MIDTLRATEFYATGRCLACGAHYWNPPANGCCRWCGASLLRCDPIEESAGDTPMVR